MIPAVITPEDKILYASEAAAISERNLNFDKDHNHLREILETIRLSASCGYRFIDKSICGDFGYNVKKTLLLLGYNVEENHDPDHYNAKVNGPWFKIRISW